MSAGVLSELGEEARAAWDARVRSLIARAAEQLAGQTRLTTEFSEPGELALLDWVAFPTRVASCLGRAEALQLLDAGGGVGRVLQEEYAEWRVVRVDGRIRRVEITTEPPEYWRTLAAYEPRRTLELVASFAREPEVPWPEVYGLFNPFAAEATPEERERAFRNRMLGTASGPFNNGQRAICCMVERSNTIVALVALAAAATTPWAVQDLVAGHARSLTCSEAIPLMSGTAMPDRASDPVIVERLTRLAFEGRFVELDPAGAYIHGVEHTRLSTPCGDAVPPEWFAFDRGTVDSAGRTHYRRVVLEVPPTEGFCVDQLVDLATEEPLRHGAQVADLVQVGFLVRVSNPQLPAERITVELVGAVPDRAACEDVRRAHESFRDEQAAEAI